MDVTTSEWLRNDSSSSLLSLNVVRGITTDSGFSTLLLLGYRSKIKRAPIHNIMLMTIIKTHCIPCN